MKQKLLSSVMFFTLLTLIVPQVAFAATAATGTIIGVSPENFMFNETITLHDGTSSHVFIISNFAGSFNGQCKESGGWSFYAQPCDPGDYTVIDTGGGPNQAVLTERFIDAINASAVGITASAGEEGIDLVNDTAGTIGNQDITETVENEDFIITGMSGGTDDEGGAATPEFTDILYITTLVAGAWYVYSKVEKNKNSGLAA